MRTAILAALVFSVTVPSSPETLRWEFVQASNGQVRGTAAAAARDAQGNLFVVGHVTSDTDEDFLLVKYTAAGSIDRTFGSSGTRVWNGGFGHDRGTGVAVDGTGAVYVSGYASNGADNDAILLKYDASGQPDPSFGTAGRISIDSGGSDRAQGVAVDASGRVYLVGFTDDHVLVRRYTASGALDASFGTSSIPGSAYGIGLDALGNAYVAGVSGNDTLLLKYSSAGTLTASQSYGNFYLSPARAVAVTPAGDVAVVGQTANGLDLDILVLKYTASLDLAWARLYDGWVDEDGTGVAFGPSGEIYVAGWSSDFLIGGWNEDALLLKYTADGVFVSTQTYDGGQHDRGYGVVVDESGNATLVGGTRLDVLSLDDLLVVNYSSTATVLSKTGYEGGNGVAFGPGGSVYVTGQRWNGADFDAFTTKIRPDGTIDPVFGTREFSGDADEFGNGIAVDAAGNAYVGISRSAWGGSLGITILKYSAAGELDAGFSATFSFSNQDGIGAVALDSAGRVVVVGNRTSEGTGYTELLVLRLDPATGALDPSFGGDGIRTYENPAGWVYGSGVAFDAAGRIYASGTSNNDMLLIRLLPNGDSDPAFGDATYDGGSAESVAVDGTGRAYVVGATDDYDLIVLRYDSTGALDPTFGQGGVYVYATPRFDFGYDVGIEPDGSLIVAGETDSTFGLVTGDLLILKLTPDGVLDSSAIYDSGLGRDTAFAIAVGNGFAVAGTRGQAELWVMRFGLPDSATNGETQDAPAAPAGGGCAASLAGGSIPIFWLGMLVVILLSGTRPRML